MDNYQGDLTDIIRASGAYGSCCGSTVTSSPEAASFLSRHHWQYWQLSSVPEDPSGNFGDPFSNMRDPFLVPEQLDMPAVGSAAYFHSASTSAEIISSSGGLEEAAACFGGSSSNNNNTCVLAQKTNLLDQGRPNCNSSILPNMMQISSNNNSAAANKLTISPGDMASLSSRVVKPSAKMIHDEKASKDHCLVTNTGEGVLHISSPVIRNPGLKRRKSQGKKSICIPAPADLNSRQSGEVVPSDLWAWRKYGQKPIKGSPYPRGYYRCSSSKGCPARKQVERSMTDPKMLVITYSSDHNHQWPTQRNALAGSTRSSQPSKTATADYSKKSETTDHIQPQQDGSSTTKPPEEEEQQQESNSDSNVSPPVVKEEQCEGGKFSNNGISNSKLKYCNQVLEDLFTDQFGEMEAEYSPNLILSPQGFDDQQREYFKALHPFHHI